MNYLPFGLVEKKGTRPKYPEVSIFSSMMFSKMLFVQLSPSQLRQVALPSSVEKFNQQNIFIMLSSVLKKNISLQSHTSCIPHQFCYLLVNTAKHRQTVPAYHFRTCYVANDGVRFDQIGVRERAPQFHPVAMTVEVL